MTDGPKYGVEQVAALTPVVSIVVVAVNVAFASL